MKSKKYKKSKFDKTFINFVLDQSGSMEVCRDSTISSLNEYVESMKKQDPKISLQLTTFDTEFKSAFRGDISVFKPLTRETYSPSGCTALYDAIAFTIKQTEAWVTKKSRVLTVILTDGQENSSREYNREKIFKMIKDKESEGNWSFVYLGANQDAYAVAQSVGIPIGNAINYSTANMAVTIRSVTSGSSAFLGSSASFTTGYFGHMTQEDKDKLTVQTPSSGHGT